MTWC